MSKKRNSIQDDLETLKLKLEIEQLNQSYFKKTILPILLQTLIGILVALGSLYIYYKTNITDVKEKNMNIEAKIKYNETILKTIEIEHRKNKLENEESRLNDEIARFDEKKEKLIIDSFRLTNTINAISKSVYSLKTEKNELLKKISTLSDNKSNLENELGFSSINKYLQDLKIYPSANYVLTNELINVFHTNGGYKVRTWDSLEYYLKEEKYRFISLYILYKGTHLNQYKDKLYKELNNYFNKDTYSCTRHDIYSIMSANNWHGNEKNEMLEYTFSLYDNNLKPCKKQELLTIVGHYSFDTTFFFQKENYSLFWDYLKLNRDIFESEDTTINKYSLLMNIASHCPHLYLALVVKYTGYKYKSYRQLTAIKQELIKSVTTIDNLPSRSKTQIMEIAFRNRIFLKNKEVNEIHFRKLYNNKQKEFDKWLIGNFEYFRKNETVYNKNISEQSF